MKHTERKWTAIQMMDNDGSPSNLWAVTNGDYVISQSGEDIEDNEANAKLIAEAGTVANETGKTPRQLADENRELLKALKSIVSEHGFNTSSSVKRKALEAIKKATL